MADSSIQCASACRAAACCEGQVLAGFEKECERVEGMMIRKPGVAGSATPIGGLCVTVKLQ